MTILTDKWNYQCTKRLYHILSQTSHNHHGKGEQLLKAEDVRSDDKGKGAARKLCMSANMITAWLWSMVNKLTPRLQIMFRFLC